MDHDILPFKNAISNGVRSIMVAHILFPKIDPAHPSSLSTSFHLDILRQNLDFDGVSVTDDLDMKAISSRYTPDAIAMRVIDCEINFVIFNHSLKCSQLVLDELTRSIENNTVTATRIASRTRRFMKTLKDSRVSTLSDKTLQKHTQLKNEIDDDFAVKIEEFVGD